MVAALLSSDLAGLLVPIRCVLRVYEPLERSLLTPVLCSSLVSANSLSNGQSNFPSCDDGVASANVWQSSCVDSAFVAPWAIVAVLLFCLLAVASWCTLSCVRQVASFLRGLCPASLLGSHDACDMAPARAPPSAPAAVCSLHCCGKLGHDVPTSPMLLVLLLFALQRPRPLIQPTGGSVP
jgi:hypothetical protein